MTVELLTEHCLEFLSLTGGCTGSSESTHVKMSNCWKSHATAHMSYALKQRKMIGKHKAPFARIYSMKNIGKCDISFAPQHRSKQHHVSGSCLFTISTLIAGSQSAGGQECKYR